MPRNGSGTASIVNSFTPSTTISSSAVNANFTDIATMLTGSVASDGQTTLTGAIKGANGSAATPSYAFASDTNTGMYRKGADQLGFASAGTEAFYVDDDQTVVFVEIPLIGSNQVDSFPSGTVMLFKQTSAPTGWTKDTSNNNNSAVRIVTGTPTTGGTEDFTTAFASQTPSGTVGGTAITEAQMPLHGHPYRVTSAGESSSDDLGGFFLGDDSTRFNAPAFTGTPADTAGQQIGGTGGGQTHTHSFTGNAINLAVKYTDVIQATKD